MCSWTPSAVKPWPKITLLTTRDGSVADAVLGSNNEHPTENHSPTPNAATNFILPSCGSQTSERSFARSQVRRSADSSRPKTWVRPERSTITDLQPLRQLTILSPLLSCNQSSPDRERRHFRPRNCCGFRIAGLAEVKRIGRDEALSCNPSTSACAWPDTPGPRAAIGQGLPSRLRRHHDRCTSDSRLAAHPNSAESGPRTAPPPPR